MQTKAGVFIDEKVFISAEDEDKTKFMMNQKKRFRDYFLNNGFTVDMRSYKTKMAYCPNKACEYTSKGKG